VTCLLKDRKGRVIVTKCGKTKDVRIEHVTVWHTDVSCPDCLALMEAKR
jgi:hypothetical protein